MGQPGLADPGQSQHRDQAASAFGDGPIERLPHQSEFAFAADQGQPETALGGRGRMSTARTLQAPTGACLPFRSSASTGSAVIAWETSRWVSSRSGSHRGPAACSKRAAVFMTSPSTVSSPVPTTTSPVEMPIRVSSSTSHSRRVRLSRPIGCASPPRPVQREERRPRVQLGDAEHRHHGVADELLDPSRRDSSTATRLYLVEVAAHHPARSASGSSRSPSGVDPTTSQKTAVTTFRTSRAGSATAISGAAHELQKRAPSALATGCADRHECESTPRWDRPQRSAIPSAARSARIAPESGS